MPDYTKYKRGSEWRKWDLHIHTPETKKNDRFTGTTSDAKWSNYIRDINASTEDISVIGVTDYFSIDNYFKFKQHISTGDITKPFDLVIPNIEIRVLPVTGQSTPINLHCLFNPEIESDIENRFLAKLKFNYSGSDYSAKTEELIRLGKAFPGKSSLPDKEALLAGIAQYVVSIDVLRTIFEKDAKLRENTIIVVSNKSTDGVSGIRNHVDFFISATQSQLDATRWSIYQFSDAIFSSNDNDVFYFTGAGPDSKESVVEKCGALMPCFHGCDAHDNSKIFKPDQNRFCWIKADPTFEGLKQTLYEPADRVRISSIKPDTKNERFVISDLQFTNAGNLFSSEKIMLNENLNAIIGGKSSGKSLLLYSTATSIDPEQVDRASKRLGFEGYKFDAGFNFEVTWKNGEKDILNDIDLARKVHKITYIPQLYINYLVEKNNKVELNSLIKGILMQDSSFKLYYDEKTLAIKDITNEIGSLMDSYLQVRTRALEVLQNSKEIGKSDAILKGIQAIELAIGNGQKTSNLNDEEFTQYKKLVDDKSSKEAQLKELEEKRQVLIKVVNEILINRNALLGSSDAATGINVKGQIDRILDELTNMPTDIVDIRSQIKTDYDTLVTNLGAKIAALKIEGSKQAISKEIETINAALVPYMAKFAGQDELKKLTTQLETERTKCQTALNLEKQYASLLIDYENLRKKTSDELKRRYLLYQDLVMQINSTKSHITSEISLTTTLLFKKENFALYDQTNKASIGAGHYFESLFSGDLVNYDLVPDLYLKQLRVQDDKLMTAPDTWIPLKQKVSLENVLRGLIVDAFELDYTVTYKGDDLLNMSPGKKGTVLLILFLQISSSEYPILIDQPEDNLDNRTIYDLLCTIIKKKKRDRQIIIVSHNANLVVATDTENIIVANQEGQGSMTSLHGARFQYINGSLEHSYSLNISGLEVLYQQGIKEHVTDILEGGDEAFKQRERKYAIK